MLAEVGGSSVSQGPHFSTSRTGRNQQHSVTASFGYVNSKTMQVTSPYKQQDQQPRLGCRQTPGIVLDPSTWRWHREGLCTVRRSNKTGSGYLRSFHQWIATFRRCLSLSLTLIPSDIVLEIRDFLEEWEFILHKHKIMAEI